MKIGILGYGNMGSAIGERLKDKYQLFVLDKETDKTSGVSGLTVVESLKELASSAKIMIMAVKPQDFEATLAELKKYTPMDLIVSIAAGITTSYIESRLDGAAVIRVMPNLPAKVGEGMICLSRGRYASETDLSFSRALFDRMGRTLVVEEKMMDAVTAVSGSGPGFLYGLLGNISEPQWDGFIREKFIPGLAAAAYRAGFPKDQAQLLARATALGGMALLRESKVSPGILKDRVASKGGTTEAGLAVLQAKVENLDQAVKAAMSRSEELSKK
jgi:pyrroline-5-carboxylate reductase